jgi:hypothetical protein
VGYYIVTREMHVEPRGTREDEAHWFERAFECVKFPDWGRLKGRLVDLEMERYVLYEEHG